MHLKPKFVIGDVHGCIKTLEALVAKLPNDADIAFVGDLIDRGHNSKEVIEFVKSNNYDCVLGNHELFVITLENELLDISNHKENKLLNIWLHENYGNTTVKNYQDDQDTLISHIQWMKSLPLYIEYEQVKDENNRHLVVSHSHVFDKWKYRNHDMNSGNYMAFKKACLSSRHLNYDNSEIYNIHGHTRVQKPEIGPHKSNIDTGCVYGLEEGGLSAIEFPSKRIYTQKMLD